MASYNEWRVRCLTEALDKTWILRDDEADPTTCPTNTAHTIDTTKTVVLKTIQDNIVTIKEEDQPTGGHFGCATLKINAIKNTTSSACICWPHPVSALSINIVTTDIHKGDKISMSVGKDTIIGAITNFLPTFSNWTSQNYTVGQTVGYTGPYHGYRIYTCVVNTVSNEGPLNTSYWQHGLAVSVSPTVTANTQIGYYLNLFNGVTTDNLGRVIMIDKNNGKVYVEYAPVNSYSPASPTYVRQTAYAYKDFEIGEAWGRQIGESTIGGAYIPKDVYVTAEYQNFSTDTDKVLIGHVEYLY